MRLTRTWFAGSLLFAALAVAQPVVAQDVNDDTYEEAGDDEGMDLGWLGLLGLAGLLGLRRPKHDHVHTTHTTHHTPPGGTGPTGTGRI